MLVVLQYLVPAREMLLSLSGGQRVVLGLWLCWEQERCPQVGDRGLCDLTARGGHVWCVICPVFLLICCLDATEEGKTIAESGFQFKFHV